MASSTLFTTDRCQALRLPKAVAFPGDVHQVDVLKVGRSRVIVPKGQRWDDLFPSGPRLSDDFMIEREQSSPEEREPHRIGGSHEGFEREPAPEKRT